MIADLLARVSQSETLSLGLPCGPGLQASRSEPRRAKTGDNPSKQRSMDEGTDDSSMRESAVLADYPADMVDGANARLDEASYYTVNNKNLSSPPEKYAESDSAEEEEKGQGEVEAGKSGPVADKPMFELGEVDETLPLVTIADVEQLASALKSDLSSDGEKAVVMWYVDAEKIAKGRETGEKANRTYSTTELSCRVLSTTEVSGVVHLSLERDITKFVKAAVSEATLWTENQRSREFKEVVDEYVEPSKPVIRPARLIARKPTELIPLPALQRVVLAVDEEAFATVASKYFREYLDNFPKAKRYAFVLEFGDATGTREFVACTMHQYLKFLYGLPKLLGRGGVVRLPLTKEVKIQRELDYPFLYVMEPLGAAVRAIDLDDDRILVRVIAERGVSPNAHVGDEPLTLLDYAYNLKATSSSTVDPVKCRKQLRHLGARAPTVLLRSLKDDDEEILACFFREHGWNMSAWKDKDGGSLLDMALPLPCPACRTLLRRMGVPMVLTWDRIWASDDPDTLATVLDEDPDEATEAIFYGRLLEKSIEQGANSCYGLLLSHGGSMLKAAARAVARDEVGTLQALIATKDLDVNAENSGRQTLLDLALSRKSKQCRDVLLSLNAKTVYDLSVPPLNPKVEEGNLESEELARVRKISKAAGDELWRKGLYLLEHQLLEALGPEKPPTAMAPSLTGDDVTGKPNAVFDLSVPPLSFASGTATLAANAKPVVEDLTAILSALDAIIAAKWKRCPPLHVHVDGHTNITTTELAVKGSPEAAWAKRMSWDRTRTVIDTIVLKRNFQHVTFTNKGHGGDKPVVAGGSPVNSRAEITISFQHARDAVTHHMAYGKMGEEYNAWCSSIEAEQAAAQAAIEAEEARRKLAADLKQKRDEELQKLMAAAPPPPDVVEDPVDMEEPFDAWEEVPEGALIQPSNMSLFSTSRPVMPRGFGKLAPGFLTLGEQGVSLDGDGFQRGGGKACFVLDAPTKGALSAKCISYTKQVSGSAQWQFFGNAVPLRAGQIVRMSCWIKFIASVPPPSSNFGFKRHLPHVEVDCSWVKDCKADTWTLVQKSFLVEETGMDLLLLIFDSLPQGQEVRFTDLAFYVASQKPSNEIWWDERAEGIPSVLASAIGSLEVTPQLSASGVYRTAVTKPAKEYAAINAEWNARLMKERKAEVITWDYIATLADVTGAESSAI
jgi:hypothetical protein